MFPDSHHIPTGFGEKPILESIALDVGIKLGGPEADICRRDLTMNRTTVPKAAIDKDCNSSTSECHVRSDESAAGANRIVLSEAVARSV
ncbi:hypothetical protein A5725_13605 [Mycobacterium kubicae]|nr:hypothetical protein A5725_13605 [Mycobacterium kubicae]